MGGGRGSEFWVFFFFFLLRFPIRHFCTKLNSTTNHPSPQVRYTLVIYCEKWRVTSPQPSLASAHFFTSLCRQEKQGEAFLGSGEQKDSVREAG